MTRQENLNQIERLQAKLDSFPPKLLTQKERLAKIKDLLNSKRNAEIRERDYE